MEWQIQVSVEKEREREKNLSHHRVYHLFTKLSQVWSKIKSVQIRDGILCCVSISDGEDLFALQITKGDILVGTGCKLFLSHFLKVSI